MSLLVKKIDPPSQVNVPHCQINVPLSNEFPKFLRRNHDPKDIYLQEGHIFVSLFDHVYGPLMAMHIQAWKQCSDSCDRLF